MISMEDPISTSCPYQAGEFLALKGNPSIRGRYTGYSRISGSHRMLQLELGPNQTQFFRESQLEPVERGGDIPTLLRSGKFAPPDEFRRILFRSRLSGTLTNVLYSIEASNTEFMPHQFLPVLKFLESPVGRLLIADEVGLGKTIEALYIWQELQARQDARRLLVVCPSTLREKWKGDMLTRFGITDAEILDAKKLWELIQTVHSTGFRKGFVGIVGLEGIRTRSKDADIHSRIPRSRLSAYLQEEVPGWEEPLFDLLVIDEAHYLRNPATASHQIAEALRDVSKHVLLLTATPVHTGSDNLFNLLKLLSPENFTDSTVFEEIFEYNRLIIRGMNALLYRNNPMEALESIKKVASHNFSHSSEELQTIKCKLESSSDLIDEERIHLGRRLQRLSPFSTFITRYRKRDVFPNRVLRSAKQLEIPLTPYEKTIYETITWDIRRFAKGKPPFHIFQLVSLQRQLTSSFYASLRRWGKMKSRSLNPELWEDLGVLGKGKQGSLLPEILQKVTSKTVDMKKLYVEDVKFKKLLQAIRAILQKNPKEKIIIFSYYRATIDYLHRRLLRHGIQSIRLKGGMQERKWEVLRSFQSPEGPQVLVSSEVGSEGIDLQFCRYLFNYDLPWNPMRLEQRIGRLDRIGQQADKILIYNLCRPDTIEDRVVMRLYTRIHIFEESIGDLEDILGNYIERAARILIDPDLTEEEREQRILQSQQALVEQRQQMRELEEKAVDFFHHQEFILSHVIQRRESGQYIKPVELKDLVKDFFTHRYPQTTLQEGPEPHTLFLLLSPEGKGSLGKYIEKTKPALRTSLVSTTKPVLCIFDPKVMQKIQLKGEQIPIHHPLIRWIMAEYQNEFLYPLSAIQWTPTEGPALIGPGIYLYLIQRWKVEGIRKKDELVFYLFDQNGKPLFSETDKGKAEVILRKAAEEGTPWDQWNIWIDTEALQACFEASLQVVQKDFDAFVTREEEENESYCNQQARNAQLSAERRENSILETIQKLTSEGKTKMIKAHEGRLRSVRENLERALTRIDTYRREFNPSFSDVAAGLLFIP